MKHLINYLLLTGILFSIISCSKDPKIEVSTPHIFLYEAENITRNSATFSASVDNIDASTNNCGFKYGKASDFPKNTTNVNATVSVDHMYATVSKLEQNTEYKFIAYVSNKYQTFESQPATFKTDNYSQPKITLKAPQSENGVFEASITEDGGYKDFKKAGFCWSTTNKNPQISKCEGSLTVEITLHKNFQSPIHELDYGKTYYINAFVQNNEGDYFYSTNSITYENKRLSELIIPDSIFKKYLVTYFDLDQNGEISTDEAKKITVIDVRTNNIESVKGIEKMPNLENLKLNGMKSTFEKDGILKSIDLSGNKSLIELNCEGNQLISLDLNNLNNLETVQCGENQLKSIKLPQSERFKYLACGDNQLSELDLSNYKNLETVYCWDNQLESIKLNGCFSLIKLRCQDNQLESIELPQSERFESLFCGRNQLTELDLSNLNNLEEVFCDENQLKSIKLPQSEQFRYLACDNNQLTELDLSNYKNFETIHCGENQLKSIKLPQSERFESLFCGRNQLTELDLSNYKNLETVYCWDNQLESIKLDGCSSLKDLSCSENQLTSLNLSNFTSLEEISCYDNPLKSLDLSGCTSLKELFCMNTPLKSLDLSGCSSLVELTCRHNQLKSFDLSDCTSLKKLDCGTNQLTTLDISKCTKLRDLSCMTNPSLKTIWVWKGFNEYILNTCYKDSEAEFKEKY